MSAPDAEPARHTTTTADGARHVFISFASEDLELAHSVVQRLERSGFRCWISDRDIEPAASYPAAITAAVEGSGALLLLLTESANRSPHVVREVELAFNARTPILAVRISGVLPSSDLQYFLSTTQWFDAGSSVDVADYAKVESRLRELLRLAPVTGTGGTGDRRWWLRVGAVAALLAAVGAALFLTSGRREYVPQAADAMSNRPADGPPPVYVAEGAATSPGIAPKVNPRDGQAYVWIPPGRFVMGCSAGDPACEDDEKPAHPMDIRSGFWLARTEVTNAQYRKASTREPNT